MKIPALRYSHLNPEYFQAANKPSPPPSLPTSLIPGRTPALPSLPSGKTKRFWMFKRSFILFQVWASDLSPLAPPPANLTDLLVKAAPAGRWDPLHLLTDLLIPQEPCLDQFLSLKVRLIRLLFGTSGILNWMRFLKDIIRRIFNRCKAEFQLRPLFPFLSGSHRHSWIRMHSGRGFIEMGETSSVSWSFVIVQCHSLFHPKCVSIPAWQVASIQATFKCKVMSSSSLSPSNIYNPLCRDALEWSEGRQKWSTSIEEKTISSIPRLHQ